MKETATVAAVDGKLMAQVLRPEACKKCRACELSRQEHFYLPLPEEGTYAEGDTVMITLEDGRVSKASLIAYGIPLGMFLIGLFGGSFFQSEGLQAVSAIVLAGIGFLIVRWIDKKLSLKGTYTPKMRPCARIDIEEGNNNGG